MALTVVQLLPALESGGVERGVLEVNKALCDRGHRSVVVSQGGRLVSQLLSDGGQHVELPIHRKSPITLACVPALRRLARDIGADVLHARSRVPAWVTYFAWRSLPMTQRPVFVTSVHGLYSVNRYSRIMTYGQTVEVVSRTVRDYVLKHYPKTNPTKLLLNYRGVDPSHFPYGYQPSAEWRATWKDEYPELTDKFIITLAGRITRLKGHRDLFEVVAGLRRQGLDAHGLVVGETHAKYSAYAKELHGFVAALGLTNHITFTGHRSDIKDVLSISDAVVSLSTKPESFGRSVLEAVRLGRPVVGYDQGGVGEVLAAVYPSGLAPARDTAALADRLASIASGRTPPPGPVGDRFLLSDMLERTVAMYRDAVGVSP